MIRYKRIKTTTLALTALTLLFGGALSRVPGSYASYRTGEAADTEARVASFDVEAGDPVLISPDGNLDCNDASDQVIYEIPVINRSEVSVRSRVVVSGYGDNVNCSVTYDNEVLPALNGTGKVRLQFSVKDRSDKNQPTNLSDLKYQVIAEQEEGGDE